jgi:hypothetical protein
LGCLVPSNVQEALKILWRQCSALTWANIKSPVLVGMDTHRTTSQDSQHTHFPGTRPHHSQEPIPTPYSPQPVSPSHSPSTSPPPPLQTLSPQTAIKLKVKPIR